MNLEKPHRKIFWNDTETGGINPQTDALLQIAFIIAEPDGTELATFSSHIMPLKNDRVEDSALAVNNLSRDEIYKFPDPYLVYHNMRLLLDKFGYCKNKALRYVPAGYNNEFDLQFIMAWMTKLDSKFAFWDFLQMSPIDPLPTLRAMRYAGIINIPDTKLGTVCNYLKIPIAAHDALSDVRATKELTTRLYTKIFRLWTGTEHTLLGATDNG